MYDEILYEVDDPVATITLNRPDSLNAWTNSMDEQVRDAITRASADRRVVGIVVTGAGRAFCAGADMSLLTDITDAVEGGDGVDVGGAALDAEGHADLAGRFPYLLAVDKPIVAAVNGAVAGMAYPLTLCCDLRFGTPDSVFLTAFAQRGLIAEWGLSWLLPRLVGPAVALDLLLSSRKVRGEEAFELGLLNRCVAPDELLPACRDYVEQLAANCSPASMATMKRQVYEQLHAGLGAAELASQRLMHESFTRPDFAEGVRSFVEKRPPVFPRIGG